MRHLSICFSDDDDDDDNYYIIASVSSLHHILKNNLLYTCIHTKVFNIDISPSNSLPKCSISEEAVTVVSLS